MKASTGKSFYCWILLLALLCIRGRCDKLEGYSFPVYNTTSCPRNQLGWYIRSSALNCTKSNGYMCIPNENITQLLEFCYRYPRIPIEKNICLFLKKTPSLVEAYSCKQFRNGCPNKLYWSNEIFEYPSCLVIGHRCFLAEPLCIDEGIATTSLGSTTIPDIDESNTWVWILVLGVFLIVVSIPVCVLIFISKRGIQTFSEETNHLKMDISGEREFLNMEGDEAIPLMNISGERDFLNMVNEADTSEEPLPFRWSMKSFEEWMYFVDHNKKETTFVDPRCSPLPVGWEQRTLKNGRIFYIDHNNRRTQWNDPRIRQPGDSISDSDETADLNVI